MEATIAAPAPAAPVAAPTSAPVSAPVSAPAATQAPTTPTFTRGGVTSAVDPNAHPIREDYAAAVLKEKLSAIPEVSEEAPAVEVADPTVEVELPGADPTEAPEVPAPDAETPAIEEAAAEEVPEFDFDPPGIVTPEAMSQMITSNPEFGKLLEADSRLKGQLFKTAREAAELQPYRDIFPDLGMAQSAAQDQQTYNSVRNVFMGSTTREGAQKALQNIAELAYERDDNGDVVMQNGSPVIGEDFYGFVDNTVRMDIENRVGDVWQRFSANKYHEDSQFTTQEQVNAAYAKDMQSIVDAVGEIMNPDASAPQEELPAHLQDKAKALDAREQALNQREHGGKVESRQQFESGLVTEADNRMANLAKSAIATAKKSGAVIQPFLEKSVIADIKFQLLGKIKSVPSNITEMEKLQELPANDASKTRRLAAIDRKIQQYAPDIVKSVFAEAGIQTTATAKERAAKRDAQIETTKQTEIKGGTGRPSGAGQPITAKAADVQAQAEWQKANPGRPFDRQAQTEILPRVLQLMTSR